MNVEVYIFCIIKVGSIDIFYDMVMKVVIFFLVIYEESFMLWIL